jgi:predicted Zn-dependent protease
VVNAFALPGGYIYITRGIMAQMNSEAQLAGVLGHEIGHVTARHSAQQITNQQIAQVGLLVGMVAFSGFREYGGLAAQGMGLLFLKYSRDHESQADELGVQYTARAKYDPRQIPATYETLKRIGDREGAGLPNFLSTHPDPGDRQVRTRQLAEATVGGAALNLEIGAANYRRHVEGLVYGDDPRAGYFENSRFYHPQLGFQLIFPSGWKTVNNPSAVVATNENLGATMQLTLGSTKNESLTPSEYVDSLRVKNAISSATGHPEQFRDYPAWVGNIVMQSDQGQSNVAAGFVRIKPGQFLEIIGQSEGGRGDGADLRGDPQRRSFGPIRKSSTSLRIASSSSRHRIPPRFRSSGARWAAGPSASRTVRFSQHAGHDHDPGGHAFEDCRSREA